MLQVVQFVTVLLHVRQVESQAVQTPFNGARVPPDGH